MESKSYLSYVLSSSIILILPEVCLSTWNFSAVDLTNDVPIWRFAIWRNRAFLSIPRFSRIKGNGHSGDEATLLEAVWPEPGDNYTFGVSSSGSTIHAFPKSTNNTSTVCERLLSVTGLDVDSRGRLWLLDSTEEVDYCPPKIVVYDLRRNDREVARIDLPGVPKSNLRSLVVDPFVGIWGPRAYIGDPGDETIITYSLFQRKWWKLRLNRGPDLPRVCSTEIAISRKSSLLYLTGTQSQDLFSLDLRQPRIDWVPPTDAATERYTVKWLGTKMGSSSGMVCDQKGGLHYFLITEHASVRWDAKQDLKTASHSILLQNEDVPCVTDYRLDMQRNVWGLVNLQHPFAKSSSSNFDKHWNAKYRTVRIYKFGDVWRACTDSLARLRIQASEKYLEHNRDCVTRSKRPARLPLPSRKRSENAIQPKLEW